MSNFAAETFAKSAIVDHAGSKIEAVVLRVLKLPLLQPYRLSYRTFHEFEPFIAEVRLSDGRVGWGEGHISPGSSKETREGGWKFAQEFAASIIGLPADHGRQQILAAAIRSPVASTALVTGIEMAVGHPLLSRQRAVRMPLLTPINSTAVEEIAPEIESLLADGFRTFKVKVGKSVADDLLRVRAIQEAVRNRASLRLDANRAFDREQALAFVRALDPDMIELFEQPCASEAWDDNAAVAAESPVPLMLDEPICSIADIQRASAIPGIGYCKIKLKRFTGLDRLLHALQVIREYGLKPVLGDGLSSDLGCWMEAFVGTDLIEGAGEFNGFLKTRDRLLSPGLRVVEGHLEIVAGFRPAIDWFNLRQLVTQEIEVSAR